jgi:hypothetical protein
MSMNNAIPNAFRIPFCDLTRKRRQWTAALSLVSITMVWGNIWPENFTALGFSFGPINQRALCWILITSIVYCLFGLIFSAISDGVENRAQFHLEEEQKARQRTLEPPALPGKPAPVPSDVQFYQAKRFHNPIHKRLYVVGMAHDWGGPLILAFWAIAVLLSHILRTR